MTWIKSIPPKLTNDHFSIYEDSIWFKEMDRCWIRVEDGTQVCSRLIRVPEEFGGKIEHVTITCGHKDNGKIVYTDGEGEITWSDKQAIKNELFGENRLAIEIFPKRKKLIDTADVYHLWVFDKKFTFPFGIHPSEHTNAINRGCSMSAKDIELLKKYYKNY